MTILERPVEAHRSLLTIEQVADWLGTTERQVKRFIEFGKIDNVKVGRLVRFQPEAVEAFIAINTRKALSGAGSTDG